MKQRWDSNTIDLMIDRIKELEGENLTLKIASGEYDEIAMVHWEDVNFVIKWTLKNIKHLESCDTYLIEKETDNCHLALMQRSSKKE